MSATYSDVDGSSDPADAVAWQDRVDRWPQIQAYKQRVRGLLAPARRVLDVGCGPGLGLASIGPTRGVGVDRSLTMCHAAARRGCLVAAADIAHLPFADASFDGVVADRVVQHVDDPQGAIAELVRVTGRRGRLVVADPDQATLAIDVPGVRPSVLARLTALRGEIGYRHGTHIAGVPDVLASFGLLDITVDAFPLVLTDPGDAFGLPGWPLAWRLAGRFSDDELEEWDAAMERAATEGIRYAVSYIVVGGRIV